MFTYICVLIIDVAFDMFDLWLTVLVVVEFTIVVTFSTTTIVCAYIFE